MRSVNPEEVLSRVCVGYLATVVHPANAEEPGWMCSHERDDTQSEGSSGRRAAYLVIPWARGLKLAHKTKRPSQYWRGTLGRTALPRVCSQAT
jgi:hypothetical protein